VDSSLGELGFIHNPMISATLARAMCGRFTLARSPEDVARAFDLDEVLNFPPRYNIAPSQPVGVVVRGKNAEA
jgi:hypothetical protein